MIDIALQERLLGEIKYANLLNIFITLGHRDSVTCTGFSHDGVYVATADLSGLVKVWKVQTKQEVFSFECSDAEVIHSFCGICVIVKGGPSGLGTKIVQKYEKKSSLYSQSLLIFIHKTPVVKNHPTRREIRDSLRPRSTPTGNMVYLYRSSSLIYILEIHRQIFKHSI